MINLQSDRNIKWLIFALAFIVYANTIGHDYTWDDSIVITENPRVKRGFMGIPDLLVKYNSDYKADKYGYRPIVLISFAVEYGLFKDNPTIGHLMNVVYFALLCSVIYGTLRLLFFKLSNLIPFLITLLFLAHPIHVEVVANIKSRDEIFALLFSLLAIQQLLSYLSSQKIKPLALSVFFFFLAFLSKENSITLLFIMPVTALFYVDKIHYRKLLGISLLTLALLVISFAIVKLSGNSTYGVEASKGAGVFYENGILGNSFFYTDKFSGRLANTLCLLLLYLKNFFYPVRQLYYYGYNQIPVASWHDISVIVSLILNTALLLFAILQFKKRPGLSYGIFFYFISISVYTHLFFTLADTMADRFLFAPSLGLCILIVFLLSFFSKLNLPTLTLSSFLKSKNNAAVLYLKYGFVIVFGLLAFKTFARNRVWKNNDTLISHDMPALENCARAHNYYADRLKSQLHSNYNASTEAEMVKHYRRGFEISKAAYYCYLGLGTYYLDGGRPLDAIAVLDTMVSLFPQQADPHFYLGRALYDLKKFEAAQSHLQTALELAPAVMNTYYFLALTHSRLGQFEKALNLIETAKKRFSETQDIYDALGTVYFDMGNMQLSAKNSFEMLRFGANPELIYKIVIGRCQFLKQDSLAAMFFKEARSRGVFK